VCKCVYVCVCVCVCVCVRVCMCVYSIYRRVIRAGRYCKTFGSSRWLLLRSTVRVRVPPPFRLTRKFNPCRVPPGNNTNVNSTNRL